MKKTHNSLFLIIITACGITSTALSMERASGMEESWNPKLYANRALEIQLFCNTQLMALPKRSMNNSWKMLIDPKMFPLCSSFLNDQLYAERKATKKFYTNIPLPQFMMRLCEAELSNTTLEKHHSDDEMKFAALLGISKQTTDCHYSAWFAHPGHKSEQEMLITKEQNTEKKGYEPNQHIPCLMNSWSEFYDCRLPLYQRVDGEKNDVERHTIYAEEEQDPVAKTQRQEYAQEVRTAFNQQYVQLTAENIINFDKNKNFINGYFNKTVYRTRIRSMLESFLDEANQCGKANGKPVYVKIIGNDIAQHNIYDGQTQLMLEVYKDLLSTTSKMPLFEHISDIDFTGFDEYASTFVTNLYDHAEFYVGNKNRVKIHFSQKEFDHSLAGYNNNKLVFTMHYDNAPQQTKKINPYLRLNILLKCMAHCESKNKQCKENARGQKWSDLVKTIDVTQKMMPELTSIIQEAQKIVPCDFNSILQDLFSNIQASTAAADKFVTDHHAHNSNPLLADLDTPLDNLRATTSITLQTIKDILTNTTEIKTVNDIQRAEIASAAQALQRAQEKAEEEKKQAAIAKQQAKEKRLQEIETDLRGILPNTNYRLDTHSINALKAFSDVTEDEVLALIAQIKAEHTDAIKIVPTQPVAPAAQPTPTSIPAVQPEPTKQHTTSGTSHDPYSGFPTTPPPGTKTCIIS